MRRFFLYASGVFLLSQLLSFGVEMGESLKLDYNLLPFSSGFVHYRVQNQKLQLIFLNQKKVVIAPPAEEGLVQVRFINPRTQSDRAYVLPLMSQKTYLETIRPLRLPLNYRLYVTLKMKDSPASVSLPAIELRPGDLNAVP